LFEDSSLKDTTFKFLIQRLLFRDGSIKTIRLGPLSGMRYRVNEITRMSAWYSGPERAHQRLFRRLLSKGDAVIDVGANWGLHTLLFSRLVGPGGNVIAVEPEPRALAELRWHVRYNNCANIVIRPCALAESSGSGNFFATKSAYTGHLSHLEQDGNSITVAIETLDNIVANQKPRLIKIDVEGAESRVLSGAGRTLVVSRPHFVIDLHTPEQDVAVAQTLIGAHYKIRRLDGSVVKHVDRGWPDRDGVWGTIHAEPL
jgi:FkbM family methyltransferase